MILNISKFKNIQNKNIKGIQTKINNIVAKIVNIMFKILFIFLK